MTGMSSSSSWPTSLASAKCRVVVDRNELFEAVFTQNGEDKGGQSNGYNDNDKNQGVHLHLFLQLFSVRTYETDWILVSNSFFFLLTPTRTPSVASYFLRDLPFFQSRLAEVSKTGPSRIYVTDPWSQIGCPSLSSKVSYNRFRTRGLLRKYKTPRFSTPQLDQGKTEILPVIAGGGKTNAESKAILR